MELFDVKTPQTLLYSSFGPHKKQNLSMFLQKFDRYDVIPLQKEVPCSNVKTKFIKSSSFKQVLNYFSLQFSLKRNCVSLYFIKLIPKNKIYTKTSIWAPRRSILQPFLYSGVQLEDGAQFFDYLVNSLEK